MPWTATSVGAGTIKDVMRWRVTSMSCFDVQQLVRRFQSSYFKINKIDWLED